MTPQHLRRAGIMMRLAIAVLIAVGLVGNAWAQPKAPTVKPEGEMRWALYVTLAPGAPSTHSRGDTGAIIV